jgi:nucleotide-binding universal stress UspA family protein
MSNYEREATMERTIVCAIDDDEMFTEVVATAGELAATIDARVVLVHVQPDPPLLPGTVEERERARHRVIRTGMAVLVSGGDMLPAELDIAYRAEFGPVAEMLCRVAEEENASLLLAGCRRRGALASTILGSVSHDLAREAPCPVVIVPRRTRSQERPRQGLVVGIDGSEQSVAAAAFAGELSDGLGDRVLLVHGYGASHGASPVDAGDVPTTEVPGVMSDALACVGPRTEWLVEPGRPANVLRDTAIREQARFIVIGGPGRDGLRPSLIGSVAAELPRHAPCPVIVVRGLDGVGTGRGNRAKAGVAA